MEYLQYEEAATWKQVNVDSFKPCYKWNTFNTLKDVPQIHEREMVLNLVINGIPSILYQLSLLLSTLIKSFKPCYKWNTFNTMLRKRIENEVNEVLNLVINGIPSIRN